ncbi:MAG: AAA family ATPase [Flavobacteriales bacterium]|nr:AAA family ATPase [Flavobacteriales bacterium]
MYRKIVGRNPEKETLNSALNSHRSELIAVYGRRRIGKTYLIREFFQERIIFSFTGLNGENRPEQIENFMLKLSEVTSRFAKEDLPENWLQAFSKLKEHLKSIRKSRKKKVIFIDEFPWADSQRSGFLSAFENFWNDYCTTRDDLVVVVCGSAASYMVKKIIRNKGGLHNRITRKIKLKPFNLYETQSFLKYKGIPLPPVELLKIYMTFGGVAEYLEHIAPGDSAVTAIDRLCFQPNAQFENEYDDIFISLFDENSYHEKIISALANGPKKGLSRDELLEALGIASGGSFTKSLNELMLSGFVLKYDAYASNRKTKLFRIYDEFCSFHLQFMTTFKGSKWSQVFQKPAYTSWCGYAFETICLKHVETIKKALKCDQIESNNYSWNNDKAQIDLVIDRNDGVVNLCELKFYNDTFEVTSDYAAKLRNKEAQFRSATGTKKGLYTTMITTWGIKGKHSIGLVTSDITAEVLFQED